MVRAAEVWGGLRHSALHAIDDAAGDGGLKLGTQVGYVLLLQGDEGAGLLTHRGLQTSEGEIELRPPQHRSRQPEAAGATRSRRPFDRHPAGKAQAQQLCRLVEGLA